MAGGSHPSLRVLAEGAGVDAGTLRHYFGDRRGVVQAAFEHLLKFGQERQAWAKSLAELPVREAFTQLLGQIAAAWSGALGGLHATGFSEGMADSELGQIYVSSILEPTLSSVEELLIMFHARGELSVPNARVAALALMSPLLLALFHQHQLQGRRCRPLVMESFVEQHLDGFLKGYTKS
ncbi:TetR/AcrR family transcriptional regulator [Archangium lansingense]|uniref:TetR/AcrR family transcriptional regulator n=2 Tax=Archangium lansingense TaxID=2995310 RepID=A0ABT4A8X8_9BACT|nr:TetR/AcrR family transcriptional regulator [Archangium lansinium]MCY1078110.1 TetR/AcrR family transcriptional regulator [Archangium lansinium]